YSSGVEIPRFCFEVMARPDRTGPASNARPGGPHVIRRRFLFGALMLALFALGWWVGRGRTGDLYANLDVFVEVLQRVEDNYVDPVKPADAIKGAIDGMLKDLDPYSQYLDSED